MGGIPRTDEVLDSGGDQLRDRLVVMSLGILVVGIVFEGARASNVVVMSLGVLVVGVVLDVKRARP